MGNIHYFSEDIVFSLDDEEGITQWVHKIVATEGRIIEQLNFIFCSDDYLLNLNKDYLHHDYFTDIITFDNSESDLLNGDIFISIDRAVENSKKYAVASESEIHRLLSHGVLHLVGFDDKTSQDKDIMTQKEDYYLSLLS